MGNVFFTSDTHFGHKLMLRRQNLTREQLYGMSPVTLDQSIQAMDEEMIQAWNRVVGKSDRVYHLGDVSLHKPPRTREILSRLNGFIYLIRGNHEDAAENGICKPRFMWIKDYLYFKINNEKIVLCHYPMASWRSSHHGSWMLHGHSHGTLKEPYLMKRLDVGIDVWKRPISYEEVAALMQERKFVATDGHIPGILAE